MYYNNRTQGTKKNKTKHKNQRKTHTEQVAVTATEACKTQLVARDRIKLQYPTPNAAMWNREQNTITNVQHLA